MRNIQKKSSKGQIWIETVIYTLIGLAIIGTLLVVSKPKIDEMKDRLLIEQTIDSLNKIDAKIYEVQRAPGNRRVVDLKISKGRFIIDSDNDKIFWILESTYEYSESGIEISLGNLKVLTTGGGPWVINLSLDYAVDLTYNGKQDLKELSEAPSPYTLFIENKGTSDNKRIVIDLRTE